MGMAKRTIDENIKRFLDGGRTQIGRRGGSRSKWDEDMTDAMLSFVDNNNDVCSGMVERLHYLVNL